MADLRKHPIKAPVAHLSVALRDSAAKAAHIRVQLMDKDWVAGTGVEFLKAPDQTALKNWARDALLHDHERVTGREQWEGLSQGAKDLKR